MRLTEEQIWDIHLNCIDGQGFRSEPWDFELYRDAKWEELEADFTDHTIYIKEPVIYMMRTTGGYHSFGDRGYFYGANLDGYVDKGWDSFVVLNDVLRILKPDLSYLYYEEITKLIRKASKIESNSFIDYNEDGSFMNGDRSWCDMYIRFVIPSELYVLLERLQMFEERSVVFDKQNSRIVRSPRSLPIQQIASGYYGSGNKEYKPHITDQKFLLFLDGLDAGDSSLLDEMLENYNFDAIQGSLLQQRNIVPRRIKENYFSSEKAIIDASEPSFDYKGVRSKEKYVCLMIKDEQYSVQTGDNTRVLACENYPLSREGLLAAIKLVQLEAKQHGMIYSIYRAEIELEKYKD